MNIISICALAIIGTVLTITLKRHNHELSILISIGSAVIILLCVLEYVLNSIDSISTIFAQANISTQYVVILLKVLGICFLTEFTCDCTKESGLLALSGNIALAGKILVLITAMPMFMEVLDIVVKLTGGESLE